MKKIFLPFSVACVAAMALSAQSSDPVVMKIDGRDVTLSEFEYLFNKNNSQQTAPVTHDQYVDMFINYKLKVADALNEKLDTTSAFRGEFERFRRDLAQPYLRDTIVEEQLVEEAYGHTAKEVQVSHIMLDARDPQGKQKADSIRQLIVSGQAKFEDLARENSVDQRSAVKGGLMGWVAGPGMYPWAFEKAAFDTPIGQYSDVVNSGFGYHIVRPEQERPSRGEVQVRHILLLTRGLDADAKAKMKDKIDSLYKVVTAPGADFADVATRESQDPGSAAKGGFMDWFGSGRMVAEFDSVSFALPVGAISTPIETNFGYHIVQKVAHRDAPSLEELRPQILKQMESDSRAAMPVKAKIDATAKATNSYISGGLEEMVRGIIAQSDNKCDSVAIDMISQSQAPAYFISGAPVSMAEAVASMKLRPDMPVDVVVKSVERAVERSFDEAITNIEIDQLYAENADFRNLVNEYHDGILLFDISNQKVWERAANDTVGLTNYFEKNRSKYSNWDKPRYKGYVIFAQNDSTLNAIRTYISDKKLSGDDQSAFTSALKEQFGKNVKVERVVVAKGDNSIIDYLAFDGTKPETPNQTWTDYFAFGYKVIDQPEEMADVKGAVVADYQTALESEWLKQLHKKYKVKITDKKALKRGANK